MKKRLLTSALALCLTLCTFIVPASAYDLVEIKDLLQEKYMDEIPEDILALDSLDEILDALGDPYTTYMTEAEYDSYMESIDGSSVVGIGVTVLSIFEQGGYEILSILPDSPALYAGLEAGDRIIAVDGVALTESMDIRKVIAGEEGSLVTVTVIRKEDGSRRDYTMERGSVLIPIVTYEQIDKAGFIDCTSFGASTTYTIVDAMEELNDDVSVWIMDLRRNLGGTAEAATSTSGLFVGSADIVYFRDGAGNVHYYSTSKNFPDYTDKPLIVLTSDYSASASELFASATRDHRFGITVGQRTFGKGIAQYLFDERSTGLDLGGGCMKITVYRFFSPNGTTNHLIGVLPTLLISPDNTLPVSMLLAAPEPTNTMRGNYLKLTIGGFPFYISLHQATKEENRAAFTELLEALPPTLCSLQRGRPSGWADVTPERIALEFGLDYHSRAPFSDVDDSVKERNEIAVLAAYGMVQGYEDGTFRPNSTITRAEFSAMLASLLNLPLDGRTNPFSDVPSNAWYANYVSALTAERFISGYEDGTFRPNEPITYQEVLTILSSTNAWLTLDGYAMSQQPLTDKENSTFQTVPEWARAATRDLVYSGFDLDLSRAADPATRAQAANLLYQLLDHSHILWSNHAE